MTIRQTALWYTSLVITGTVAAVLWLSQNMILEDYRQLEIEKNSEKRLQLKHLVEAEKHRLETLVRDWAIWDDAYLFLQKRDPAFITSNFGTLRNTNDELDIHILQIVDEKRRTVYGEVTRDGAERSELLPPGRIMEHLSKEAFGDVMQKKTIKSYLLNDGGKLLILALHPVIPSNGDKEAVGMIVMGRYIDKALLDSLSASMNTAVTLQVSGIEGVGEGAECEARSCRNRVTVLGESGGIEGILQFDQKRDIYLSGVKTVKTLVVIVIVIALVGIALLLLFLNHSIFNRLYTLVAELGRIDFGAKKIPPVTIGGEDEITALTRTVNRLFEQLEENNRQERLLYNQARLIALGKMTRDIAHHWRQPIQVISLLVQEIEMLSELDELDKEEVRRLVQKSMKEIREMSDVIDDFHSFYEPRDKKTHFALELKVSTALAMERLRTEEVGIALEFIHDEAPQICTVYGYQTEFLQVVVSLLNNAVEAIEKRNRKDGRVIIRIRREEERVFIDIEDNGGGIDPAIREKIFDPYFSTKSELNGTGLGLYMSKVIIEKNMNGRLYCRDTEEGVCFTIELACETGE